MTANLAAAAVEATATTPTMAAMTTRRRFTAHLRYRLRVLLICGHVTFWDLLFCSTAAAV
jgi:hypothetical protein